MKKDNWDFSFRRICISIFISLFRLLTIMEDKLVTLAILTYAKAQILKNVLENEGIETCIHNIGDANKLADDIELLYKNKEICKQLAIENYQCAKEYYSDNILSQRMGFYKKFFQL